MNGHEKVGLEMMLAGIWLMITMLSLSVKVTQCHYIAMGVVGSILASIGYHIFDKEE